jgi:hypothetical protein
MASSSSATIPLFMNLYFNNSYMMFTYLLLHRAMSLLPPTMIPNIEPTPLPSTGVWNQPPGLLPDQEYSDETNAFIEAAPLPPPELSDEEEMMQDLIDYHLPQPCHYIEAPVPDSVPTPPKFSVEPTSTSKKRTAKGTPKAPAKRRKSKSNSPKRSPSPPPIWTDEDKKLLWTLKTDEKSRYAWKVIASKLGKPEPDVKIMWNHIKNSMG